MISTEVMSFLEANTTIGDNESSFDKDSNRYKIQFPLTPCYQNRSFINHVTETRYFRCNLRRIEGYKSPFKLFKDLYVSLQMARPIVMTDLGKFFEIAPDERNINFEKNIDTCREHPKYVNIVPLILFVHVKTKSQQSLSQFIITRQYHFHLHAGKLLLNKIHSRNKSFEIYNFIDTYVSSLFDDMIHKWFQWTELIIQNGGTYTLKQTNGNFLKRLLYQKFWNDHFYIQDSRKYSVNQFKSCVHANIAEHINRFGCWMDIQNNIIIFASTIYEANGKVSRTVNAICYSNHKVKQICYLMSFYINLASISCFTSNVR